MRTTDKHKRYRIRRTFFLDLWDDSRSRPVIVYSFLIIFVGAVLYRYLEGWSWVDSFYFVVITLTTIGYGDLTPTTDLTKILTIFYSLNGILILLMLFDVARRVRGWFLNPPVSKEGKERT